VHAKDSKYPVKDIAEIIVKDEEGNVRVHPPSVSLPPLPKKYKELQVVNLFSLNVFFSN